MSALPVRLEEAEVSEEEFEVVRKRLQTLDQDRRVTTPSQEVFRSFLEIPTP